MLLLAIDEIHLCEDTDRVNAVFRIGPRTTYVIFSGDPVPVSTR